MGKGEAGLEPEEQGGEGERGTSAREERRGVGGRRKEAAEGGRRD